MHPVAQGHLITHSQTFQPEDDKDTACATMVASFRRAAVEYPVTVLAVAAGFGPGWTADEACQLALQALRNQFVEAKDQPLHQVLIDGLAAANRIIYERAVAYEVDGDIGVSLLTAVYVRGHCLLARVGKGVVYLVQGDGQIQEIEPHLVSDPDDTLGLAPELTPLNEIFYHQDESADIQLKRGDSLLLLNDVMGEVISRRVISRETKRKKPERVPDKLIRIGQTRESKRSMGVLIAQLPGFAPEKPLIRKWWVRLAAVALALIILFLLVDLAKGLGLAKPEPLLPSPTVTSTMTQTPEPIPSVEEMLLLPTLIPSATPSALSVPVIVISPTNAGTRVPLTATPTPTSAATQPNTQTPTPVPPTPTETITPSPTIPIVPIEIGVRVIVVGTEGLGMSLRAEARSTSIRIGVLLDGEQSIVIGGPVGEGNLLWWHLQTVEGQEGWAVNRFLQGIPSD